MYRLARQQKGRVSAEYPALEVKMACLRRDIGDYENTTTKKILSPYPDDRIAVTDCRKLASSGFGERPPPLPGELDPPVVAGPALVSFPVSFVYVRTRSARTTRDGEPTSGTLLDYAEPWPAD
jgi:hypothetical protein